MYERAKIIFDGLPWGGANDPRVGAALNHSAIELFEKVGTEKRAFAEGLLWIYTMIRLEGIT